MRLTVQGVVGANTCTGCEEALKMDLGKSEMLAAARNAPPMFVDLKSVRLPAWANQTEEEAFMRL